MISHIDSVAAVYEKEGLRFSLDRARALIRFQMDTTVCADVRFVCRMANPHTLLACTIFPQPIPAQHRPAVTAYISRVNCNLLLGNFQLDPSDGVLCYRAAAILGPESALSEAALLRLTYVGFNMLERYMPGMRAILHGGKGAEAAYAQNEAEIRETYPQTVHNPVDNMPQPPR